MSLRKSTIQTKVGKVTVTTDGYFSYGRFQEPTLAALVRDVEADRLKRANDEAEKAAASGGVRGAVARGGEVPPKRAPIEPQPAYAITYPGTLTNGGLRELMVRGLQRGDDKKALVTLDGRKMPWDAKMLLRRLTEPERQTVLAALHDYASARRASNLERASGHVKAWDVQALTHRSYSIDVTEDGWFVTPSLHRKGETLRSQRYHELLQACKSDYCRAHYGWYVDRTARSRAEEVSAHRVGDDYEYERYADTYFFATKQQADVLVKAVRARDRTFQRVEELHQRFAFDFTPFKETP